MVTGLFQDIRILLQMNEWKSMNEYNSVSALYDSTSDKVHFYI